MVLAEVLFVPAGNLGVWLINVCANAPKLAAKASDINVFFIFFPYNYCFCKKMFLLSINIYQRNGAKYYYLK